MKLPKSFLKNEDPDKKIRKICEDSLDEISKNWSNDKLKIYRERLNIELSVITKKNFSLYFLALSEALGKIHENLLIGAGRGSGAGSLVCYLMGITLIDPVEHGLLFERFLSESRNEPPDIDCLHCNTLVRTIDGLKSIGEIKIGDKIIDAYNNVQTVYFTQSRKQKVGEKIFVVCVYKEEVFGAIIASENHKFLLDNGEIVLTKDLKCGDLLSGKANVIKIKQVSLNDEDCLVDISVTSSKTFSIIPFPVIEVEDKDFNSIFFYITMYNIDTDIEKYIDEKYRI
jgi:hypothetical protein